MQFLKDGVQTVVYVMSNCKYSSCSVAYCCVRPGPSSAFEKWSGHERSKTFTSAEGTSRGRAGEGAFPPLVRGVGGSSPRKFYISGRP